MRWWNKLTHHVHHHWSAALFMAAAVAIVHHKTPFFDGADRIAYLITSALNVTVSDTGPAHSRPTVVVSIDNQIFEQTYYEQSPLNRCILADQLATVYAQHPAVLVVDFDISPSVIGLSPSAGHHREVATCEDKLYALIKEASRVTPTVLLNPFRAHDSSIQAKKSAWRNVMRGHGIRFGSGAIALEAGIVQKQFVHPDTLAAQALSSLTPPEGRRTAAHGSVHSVSHQEDFDVEQMLVSASIKELNFKKFTSEVTATTWSAWSANPSSLPLQGKNVFFGANYGEDDRFLTPIDDLYGVHLHAAGFESLRHPISKLSMAISIAIDFVWGLVVALLIGWAWKNYFEKSVATGTHAARGRALAPLYIIVLLFCCLILALGLSTLSSWLVGKYSLWISPMPIAFGMLFEGFVTGSLATAKAALGRPSHAHSLPASGTNEKSSIETYMAYTRWAIWFAVVGYAATLIFDHH